MNSMMFSSRKIRKSGLFVVAIVIAFTLLFPGFLFTTGQAKTDIPPEEYRGGMYTKEDIKQGFEIQEASFGIAWGDPNAAHSVYAWPYTFDQMGLVVQSYQNYSSGTSAAYFHHGIDMVAPNGTQVYTRSGGQVVNIENYQPGNDLYWEVAILDGEGYVWQYHHIDKNSIPQGIKDKFNEWKANPASGGYVPPNTHIGNIVYWTVISLGFRFNHIHLNILGAGDVYMNTLEFHTPIVDTQAPEIQEIGILNGDTVVSGAVAAGNYGLYVRARDLYQSTVYYLPPYKTEFRLDGGEWETVWEFHTLPGGSDDMAYVNDFYVPGYTKGNYELRDFYIDLGFTTSGQRQFPSSSGEHSIEVRVWDYYGNSDTDTFTWTVENYYEYENSTATGIPDNGCSAGSGVTRTFEVTEDLLITDVNLGINLSHSRRGQVRVTLKSPTDVTATTIINTASDTYDNYDVMVDDASSNALNDRNNDSYTSPYYDRTAGPSVNGSLDAFDGKNSLGTWTVFVCDNTSSTTGTLRRVKLVVSGLDNSNTAPIADSQIISTDEDTPINIVLSGSDMEGDELTFDVTSNPQHGSLSGIAPNLSYTPNPDYFGSDSLIFTVNDGKVSSDPASITLDINPVNDAPVALPQALETEQETPLSLLLTGFDVDGDNITYQLVAGPLHGVISGTIPNLVYTPDNDYIGQDLFSFTISDGQLTSLEVQITISVLPVNYPPIADAQMLQTDEDIPVGIVLTGWDPNENELTYIIAESPLNGVLSGEAPDLIYTPSQNFFGTDYVTFMVNDGLLNSDPATITIDVVPVNDGPIANLQVVSTQQDTPLSLILTGFDVEGAALSYFLASGPLYGSIDGDLPNIVYTPAAGFIGLDSFTFVVSDGELYSDPAEITISVDSSGPVVLFADDFESDQGWLRNSLGTDTASVGVFERANPETVSYYGYKQLGTTASGSFALVTGPLAGSSAGAYDLDGGVTSMRSPAINLPSGRTLTLSFKYYLAHYTNSSSADYLRVKVIGSTTTTVFQELGAANDDDAAWATFSVNLDSFAGQTVYIVVEAADTSTASLVEAAVDDMLIMAE